MRIIKKVLFSSPVIMVCALFAGIGLREAQQHYWPLAEPQREALAITCDQAANCQSVTASVTIDGVKIVWDFLGQKVRFENTNDWSVKVTITKDMDHFKLDPHETSWHYEHVIIGEPVMAEIDTIGPDGVNHLAQRYYVLGAKVSIGQNP
jgi:hypothetical protein